MSTLQERLSQAMKERPDVTAADLARACGVRGPSVHEWIYGPTKTLRGPNAINAADVLGVNVEWLSTGRGPMHVGSASGMINDARGTYGVPASEIEPGYVRFQLMDATGGAGPGVINSDHPEVLREVEIAQWQLRQQIGYVPAPARVRLLTVRGSSMSPRIREGDVVLVDIQDTAPADGALFALVMGDETLVKQLERRPDGIYIVSLAYPGRAYRAPEDGSLHIAGRVLGAIQLRKAEDLQ